MVFGVKDFVNRFKRIMIRFKRITPITNFDFLNTLYKLYSNNNLFILFLIVYQLVLKLSQEQTNSSRYCCSNQPS
jgi:hypothetical protein